jgi:hypothetical protein
MDSLSGPQQVWQWKSSSLEDQVTFNVDSTKLTNPRKSISEQNKKSQQS